MELRLLSTLAFLLCLCGVSSGSRYFTSMISFGDSYIDAGNFVAMAAVAVPVVTVWIDKPPYGMTFFGHPTGRCSDGRDTIDFIVEKFGLPLLPASLANSSSATKGKNFAVGSATVTDVDFFEKNKLVQFKLVNNSLSVQLDWFEELKPRICNNTRGCRDCFSKTLFIFGELGVNDYSFLWFAGKTQTEVRSFVPRVVKKIVRAWRLINEGAAYIVVPGNPPNGCSPTMLTLLARPNKTDYDYIGCLRDLNGVARIHNSLLRAAVVALRGKYPHARIIFAAFYNPIMEILQNPRHFGVAATNALRACCGAGGTYNWSTTGICGMPGVKACKDPAAYVSWDGVHYTEATNHYIAKGWLHGPYADPPILTAIRH